MVLCLEPPVAGILQPSRSDLSKNGCHGWVYPLVLEKIWKIDESCSFMDDFWKIAHLLMIYI